MFKVTKLQYISIFCFVLFFVAVQSSARNISAQTLPSAVPPCSPSISTRCMVPDATGKRTNIYKCSDGSTYDDSVPDISKLNICVGASGGGSVSAPTTQAPVKVDCKHGADKDGSCKIPIDCQASAGEELNPGKCQLLERLLDFTNVLSGIVGIVVVMMIIIGGIQYSSAGGDPKKVAGAKSRIYNAIFAFMAFIFMYSFLQWLIPGGVFNQ